MSKKNNVKTLDQFVDEQYGKKGTSKRDKFEKGYETFKLGFLIQQARLEKGLTQEELAEKCGTNKGYISKIENNIKEVRISTLQKIVELGLGGHLELSIKLWQSINNWRKKAIANKRLAHTQKNRVRACAPLEHEFECEDISLLHTQTRTHSGLSCG